MKLLFSGLLLLSLACSRLPAQTMSGGAPFDLQGQDAASPSPSAAAGKKGGAVAPQPPTVIDSEAMDYDEKTRLAIFSGDDYGVYVKDPSFVVYCDKLTAHMRKGSDTAGAPGAKGKASPHPSASPAGKGNAAGAAAAASGKANGLQSALAEGALYQPVVIVQDKPASNGQAAIHNVGIAEKANYNADTGDVVLTGWPRVSQGGDTQIATAEYTVMTMNKDGHTMKTRGPSRTVIQPADQPKKTGTNSESPDQSPSSTPQ